MPILETTYSALLAAARLALPLLARGEGKLARGVRGRAGVLERAERWAKDARDPARPLVWMHAPSVGEGLQARETLRALRARRAEVQIVYTYFSPSAERFARSIPAEFTDYLPLDTPREVRRMLDALRPDVLAFSKTDVWPVLTREAARRGVRMALLSATLPAGSSRLSGAARALLAPAYQRLDRVAAISAADAERFAGLGVPAERRSVMGDARFDQVAARAAAANLASPLLAPLAAPERATLVAGSTWPADEERLLPALARLKQAGVPLRTVLVPHEPTPEHLAESEASLARLGISSRRLSEPAVDGDVLLVDRVGVLGDLYALADVAYVGGGWGSAGLHSVLEPAAFGAPVLFGPRHQNAREAAELIALGGAFAPSDPEALHHRLATLLSDPTARAAAGEAAAAYVHTNVGAATRGAEVIEELM